MHEHHVCYNCDKKSFITLMVSKYLIGGHNDQAKIQCASVQRWDTYTLWKVLRKLRVPFEIPSVDCDFNFIPVRVIKSTLYILNIIYIS